MNRDPNYWKARAMPQETLPHMLIQWIKEIPTWKYTLWTGFIAGLTAVMLSPLVGIPSPGWVTAPPLRHGMTWIDGLRGLWARMVATSSFAFLFFVLGVAAASCLVGFVVTYFSRVSSRRYEGTRLGTLLTITPWITLAIWGCAATVAFVLGLTGNVRLATGVSLGALAIWLGGKLLLLLPTLLVTLLKDVVQHVGQWIGGWLTERPRTATDDDRPDNDDQPWRGGQSWSGREPWGE
jgi:hypothetical protein